jgi:hypothetical protein
MKSILLIIAVIVLFAVSVQTYGQSSQLAQSFSQYFDPKVLRAVDNIMKDRACAPDGYWKIWTYGFHRNYRGVEGKKFEAILNWNGDYYIKSNSLSGSELITTGDWTTLK